MIAALLDSAQQRAVDAPLDSPLLITGGPATGKSTALRARLERARSLGFENPLVSDASASRLLHELAQEALRDAGVTLTLIDDVEGEMLFEQAAVPLLAMESDLIELQIDPEVPGLRSPARFLESAFRLQRRLSEALIAPDDFLARSLAGATEFYAKPPNFAHPGLISATKSEHRSSLAIGAAELARQYRREVDLAKLLAQLFRAYAQLLEERGYGTGREAIARAVELLAADSSRASTLRERYGAAFLDDVHELTLGEIALLRSVFGAELHGVTLVGDARTLPEVLSRVELTQSFRLRPRVGVLRPPTQRDEARAIAAHVAQLVREGAQASQIAVVMRSVAAPQIYEEALLDRDVPVQIGGDYNVFADRRAHDALALLWNVQDPYRHDWLLRTLEGNAMALADASLAVLCGDPAEKQTVLFEEEALAAPSGGRHRDPDRGIRLGRNVVAGDCDSLLSDMARERVQRFRSVRERWVAAKERESLRDFALLVWSEGLAREGAPGSARALAQQRVLHQLLARLEGFRDARPDASLADVLEDAERRAASDLEACEAPQGDGVRLVNVECARGESFEHVVVANVRPGAFPRWYAPNAFLFSPKLGMIPKDNVGDAPTARTAKFTYYVHKAKTGEKYYRRERRLFEYALSRARSSLLVTAFGRPTRAITAPEFLEELR